MSNAEPTLTNFDLSESEQAQTNSFSAHARSLELSSSEVTGNPSVPRLANIQETAAYKAAAQGSDRVLKVIAEC